MDRQGPFGMLLQDIGGEKNDSRSGGMDGLELGQGLHTPIALRPLPPMPVPGMGKSTLEGGPSSSQANMTVAPRMDLSFSGGPARGNELPLKRKRGRPRKYATSDPSPSVVSDELPTESLFSALAKRIAAPYDPSPEKSAEKRGRGRPLGSTKKQQLANLGVVLAGTGKSVTPHILTVNTGEDASSKIMQFAQHGPRAMCVLSANGAVSNVILRQESSTGGTVTYEGRYEILSLSGSYLPTDGEDGVKHRTGSLSVCLAGSDGRVFGGGVAGMLVAASPIQVVVGSFLLSTLKPDAKVDSPLCLTQGVTSGMTTPPVSHQHPESRGELGGSSVFTSPNLNGGGGGPGEGPHAPSTSGQASEQRPQGVGVFQPGGGWGISPHVPFLGDNRRADINIPLAGG